MSVRSGREGQKSCGRGGGVHCKRRCNKEPRAAAVPVWQRATRTTAASERHGVPLDKRSEIVCPALHSHAHRWRSPSSVVAAIVCSTSTLDRADPPAPPSERKRGSSPRHLHSLSDLNPRPHTRRLIEGSPAVRGSPGRRLPALKRRSEARTPHHGAPSSRRTFLVPGGPLPRLLGPPGLDAFALDTTASTSRRRVRPSRPPPASSERPVVAGVRWSSSRAI